MANYGFVYLLRNEAMPDHYKIGFTLKSPMQRCYELSSSTSSPVPFELVTYLETEDPQYVERRLHELYDEYRVNSGREFFKFTTEFLLNYVCREFQQWGKHHVECDYCIVTRWELENPKDPNTKGFDPDGKS
jgi:hypothetical protein